MMRPYLRTSLGSGVMPCDVTCSFGIVLVAPTFCYFVSNPDARQPGQKKDDTAATVSLLGCFATCRRFAPIDEQSRYRQLWRPPLLSPWPTSSLLLFSYSASIHSFGYFSNFLDSTRFENSA